MPLIVDTYNVLHVTGVLPPDLAGLDVAELAELIRESRYRHERVHLVCDGSPPPGGLPPVGPSVEVLYAGPHLTADELIERLVARSTDRRRLIVVSSDREVAGRARRAGCRVLRAETLLEQLVEDAERPAGAPRRPTPQPPSAGVEQWMRIFGLAGDDLDVPEAELPPALAAPDTDAPAPAAPRKRPGENGVHDAEPADVAGPLPDDIVAEAENLWRSAGPPDPATEPEGEDET